MLFVTVLAAFAFSRLQFRGKDLAFTLFLSLMMIPTELVVITNFVTITNLDLRNSFAGLILPSVTSVFYIYLLKEVTVWLLMVHTAVNARSSAGMVAGISASQLRL